MFKQYIDCEFVDTLIAIAFVGVPISVSLGLAATATIVNAGKALKYGATSTEIILLNVTKCHLVFGLFYPCLAGSPFVLGFMDLPARQIFSRHIAEEIVFFDFE